MYFVIFQRIRVDATFAQASRFYQVDWFPANRDKSQRLLLLKLYGLFKTVSNSLTLLSGYEEGIQIIEQKINRECGAL